MTETVGIFGLGLVGLALAQRLIAAGHAVAAFDPRAERMALLTEAGGTPVAVDEVWRAGLILSAVFNDTQLADLVAGAPNGSGAVLVSMSTCDPNRIAEIATAAAAKGIDLAEAPISGTSKALGEGSALLLLAGSDAALQRFEAVRADISASAIRVGAVGDGNRTKLAVNLILGLNRAAVAEGLVFAKAIGLDPATFLDVAMSSAASSAVMAGKGRAMVARDFTPLGHMVQTRKDFTLIREVAAAAGLTALPLAETYARLAAEGVEAGDGALDNAAIIRAIERAAGAAPRQPQQPIPKSR